jgi:hypothetical protein
VSGMAIPRVSASVTITRALGAAVPSPSLDRASDCSIGPLSVRSGVLITPLNTVIVYTIIVGTQKNITFSASPEAIERARLRAREQRTTLNEAFREWLERYSGGRPTAEEYRRMMGQLGHVRAGRKFTREEMNERA